MGDGDPPKGRHVCSCCKHPSQALLTTYLSSETCRHLSEHFWVCGERTEAEDTPSPRGEPPQPLSEDSADTSDTSDASASKTNTGFVVFMANASQPGTPLTRESAAARWRFSIKPPANYTFYACQGRGYHSAGHLTASSGTDPRVNSVDKKTLDWHRFQSPRKTNPLTARRA